MITLKSYFWQKKKRYNFAIMYGRHDVSRKSVNHVWFIDFIAQRYSFPDATLYDKQYNKISAPGLKGEHTTAEHSH